MTKVFDKIQMTKEQYDDIREKSLKKSILSEAEKWANKYTALIDYIKELRNKKKYRVYIKNRDVYYDFRLAGVRANVERGDCASVSGHIDPNLVKMKNFAGFKGEFPSFNEIGYFFRTTGCDYQINYSNTESYYGVIFLDDGVLKRLTTYNNCRVAEVGTRVGSFYASQHLLFPVHHFHGVDAAPISETRILLDFMKYDLIPDDGWFKSAQLNKLFYSLKSVYDSSNKHYLVEKTGGLGLKINLICKEAFEGKKPFFMTEQEYQDLMSDVLQADDDQIKDFINSLLECDYNRAGLDRYDENILIDPNRGHWDLWDINKEFSGDEGSNAIKLLKPLVARNPVEDINSGIVAIDFGTKSTVVVYKNEKSEILPLQVGSGNYAGGVKKENYENPTIIQFLDINSFMKAYNAKSGRPDTSYEDITVSSNAKQNFDVSSSTEYYSFFDELKQWCGGSKEKVKIEDKQGNTYDLPAYLDLLDTDIDPIEIYAYYLGLYINNMLQEKHIFMHYIMSFPVNYERNIREKLLRSFARGLKKSLPTALLNNEEAMKRFKVVEGATEPAAYACTALMEFGFDPVDEEKNYYGVFDFGGGTTDFDFGMLEELADGRYDYKLTHFGENGDRTLGGENLLKLMAFEVFSKNYETLLRGEKSDKVPFCTAPDSETIVGNEAIIRESREAKQNMHNLVEKLRPVWEAPDSEEAQQLLDKASIQVNLFTDKGVQVPNFPLSLKDVDLLGIIHDRIEKGIRNFFISLNQAFQSGGEEVDNLSDVAEIAIFMAGNSSKAEVVTEIFNEYIGESEDGTAPKALELFDVASKEEMPHFRLYPPLGTPQADEIKSAALQDDDEYDSDEDDANNLMRPTGKTGVAYGLLETCAGGSIKVVDQQASARNEVSFQFYIGKNRKKKFVTLMSRGADYDTWVKFIDASDDFDLLYSDKPEAATNKAPVSIAKRYHVVLDKKDAAGYVFIKPCSSTSIVYKVASSESECQQSGSGEDEPRRIDLS